VDLGADTDVRDPQFHLRGPAVPPTSSLSAVRRFECYHAGPRRSYHAGAEGSCGGRRPDCRGSGCAQAARSDSWVRQAAASPHSRPSGLLVLGRLVGGRAQAPGKGAADATESDESGPWSLDGGARFGVKHQPDWLSPASGALAVSIALARMNSDSETPRDRAVSASTSRSPGSRRTATRAVRCLDSERLRGAPCSRFPPLLTRLSSCRPPVVVPGAHPTMESQLAV
jgi:hypothetical protein